MINAISKNLLSFIKNSPSPFHSIASIKKVLRYSSIDELPVDAAEGTIAIIISDEGE